MLIEYRGKRPKISKSAFIAPDATLIGDVEVGDEASIWFGARLRGDMGKIVIGARSSVQDNAVIHVDAGDQAIIEEDVTIGHSAVLHGCTVKRGAVIGIGSIILDRALVGEQTLIAAGSVVTVGSKIPDRKLAAGIPAEVKRDISGASLSWVERSALEYVKLSRSYLEQGIGQSTPE